MPAAATTERRKRIFAHKTLTFADLRAIHDLLADTGLEPLITANEQHLIDLDQLPQLAAEEVFLTALSLGVLDRDDEPMCFTYEPLFVEIEAGSSAAYRKPFKAVCALLEAKPDNGTDSCILDLADAERVIAGRRSRARRAEPAPPPAAATAPTAPSVADAPARPPSEGLVALLRRLWGGR